MKIIFLAIVSMIIFTGCFTTKHSCTSCGYSATYPATFEYVPVEELRYR